MSSVEKYLNEGEHVVVSTRTHWKVLIGSVIRLLLTVFVAAFLTAWFHDHVDNNQRNIGTIAVWAVAAVIILWWVLRPFIGWFTATYTFTNRRFMERSGFISKQGRTIPLNRISGIDFEIGIIDRIFGCGTLIVSDASEEGRVPLKDIPDVEQVQKRVAEELHRLTAGGTRSDDGT